MNTNSPKFHVPARAFGLIAAINRAAAAIGSHMQAMQSARADYNGHRVTVEWNDYLGHWVAGYYWSGFVALARGTLTEALRAALREFDRGALGASVLVELRSAADVEGIPADVLARLTPGTEPKASQWYDDALFPAVRAGTAGYLIEADSYDGDKLQMFRHLADGHARRPQASCSVCAHAAAEAQASQFDGRE